MDKKDVMIVVAIGIIVMMSSLIVGYFVGFILASDPYYEDGVNAGIDYSNCVTEITPLYGTVTDRVLDECWETYVYESY